MKLGVWAIIGVIAVNPVIVGVSFASEANPCGNHGNHCCTDDGGESYQSTESTCAVAVSANPQAYCEAYATAIAAATSESRALAICGDAVSFCQGGTAFALSCVKQSCETAVSQAATATQTCTNACGDMTATCSCPVCPQPPDVEIGTRVLKCKRWSQRKDGTYVGKKCLTLTETYYN